MTPLFRVVGLAIASLAAGGCFSPDDGDEPADTPSCTEYCQLIQDHCEGEVAQYPGTAVCEATCGLMMPGTQDDVLGNTVGCRVHHSVLAAEAADPHCFHAGPGGDGTCGANCESFCALALAACTGDLAQWPDAEACIADCNGFAPGPPFSSSLDDADTLGCRLEHVSLAALNPDVHCSHIGVDSPVCQ